ncbi:hypothetical protein PYCC9005_004003 [Savitreella phatthalungensis]
MRPIRICGVSGFAGDSPELMIRNVEAGALDAVIGDSLAEFNTAIPKLIEGHPGYEANFMAAVKLALPSLAKHKVKVVSDGGSTNPRGAAEQIEAWIKEGGFDLKVAYVQGDDVLAGVNDALADGSLGHLDGWNDNVAHDNESQKSLDELRKHNLLAANAYLGSRGIATALREGADIVVCGRVADASLVVGLATWWHDWRDDNWDSLAAALVAGHLIECSGYGSGGNFSGFEDVRPVDNLIDIGMPIAEIAHDGTVIITKHQDLPGHIDRSVVACQLLYELQGSVYLNSDVTADLDDIAIDNDGPNRVRVTGIKGRPPPPTTKVACFYVAGFQTEYMISVTGSNAAAKAQLFRRQCDYRLEKAGIRNKLLLHAVQEYGRPVPNAASQFAGTCFLRVLIQAQTAELVAHTIRLHHTIGLEHFSGYASSLMTNPAAVVPRPFLGYYPGLWPQAKITQTATVNGKTISIQPPAITEPLRPVVSYDPKKPWQAGQNDVTVELGRIALARSGDKGGNINIGLFPRSDPQDPLGRPSQAHWEWLRDYMTLARMQELIGEDWREEYSLERVELPNLRAVHFVVYGILGRGVTSAPVLDNLGKGFADWIRSRHVQVPSELLGSSSKL